MKPHPGDTTYVTHLIDTGDGSGDEILIFPDELMEELGWKEGDILSFDKISNGAVSITKADKDAVLNSEQAQEAQIDLAYALHALEKLANEEEDINHHDYWRRVRQLLKQAAGMQLRIDQLSQELLEARVSLTKSNRH